VLGGYLWDLTGIPWTAFVPAGLFGPLMVVMAAGLRMVPWRSTQALPERVRRARPRSGTLSAGEDGGGK
jgi:hypothetical protein